MCGLGTGSASLLRQQHFHYTFEERHGIIGNGSASPESPSGHLPARPAHSTCLPAPMGWQNPPSVANYRAAGATSLGSWVQGCRVCGPAGKQSSPGYMELGKACWLPPLALLSPGRNKDTPKTPALGDWGAIDPHSTEAAQHQPFPARFFSALWNILGCFLLLPCTLSTTCWCLFPSACQSDEGTARSDSSMSLCQQPPYTST